MQSYYLLDTHSRIWTKFSLVSVQHCQVTVQLIWPFKRRSASICVLFSTLKCNIRIRITYSREHDIFAIQMCEIKDFKVLYIIFQVRPMAFSIIWLVRQIQSSTTVLKISTLWYITFERCRWSVQCRSYFYRQKQ